MLRILAILFVASPVLFPVYWCRLIMGKNMLPGPVELKFPVTVLGPDMVIVTGFVEPEASPVQPLNR